MRISIKFSSDEVQVSYTPSNDDGEPEFGYQGPRGKLTFTADEIRIERTLLGTLINESYATECACLASRPLIWIRQPVNACKSGAIWASARQ